MNELHDELIDHYCLFPEEADLDEIASMACEIKELRHRLRGLEK